MLLILLDEDDDWHPVYTEAKYRHFDVFNSHYVLPELVTNDVIDDVTDDNDYDEPLNEDWTAYTSYYPEEKSVGHSGHNDGVREKYYNHEIRERQSTAFGGNTPVRFLQNQF